MVWVISIEKTRFPFLFNNDDDDDDDMPSTDNKDTNNLFYIIAGFCYI